MKTKNILTTQESGIYNFDAKILGNTIRLLRERRQFTQSDLGTLSSLSTAEISKLENGLRKKIPLDALIKLAPHLNVSLDYLLASCIKNSQNDYERFFDFEGNEIDLFKIAKNLYTVDSTLLLLLANPDFLNDKDSIRFVKSWINIKMISNQKENKYEIIKNLLTDFMNYCFSFFDNLSLSYKTKKCESK